MCSEKSFYVQVWNFYSRLALAKKNIIIIFFGQLVSFHKKRKTFQVWSFYVKYVLLQNPSVGSYYKIMGTHILISAEEVSAQKLRK